MIRINPLFYIVAITASVFGLFKEFSMVFGIAVLHEAGHALCAKLFDVEGICFKIQPWGVCMNYKKIETTKKELLIALSGPLVNLFLLIIGSFLNSAEFFAANLFMLIINLLPVYPLDGGRMLNSVLKTEFDKETSGLILRIVSGIVVVILLVSGCILLLKTKINFSVLLASLFLILSGDRIPENETISAFTKIKHYAVNSEKEAKTALKILSRKKAVILDVIDDKGRYLGSLTSKQVMEEIAVYGYEIKFAEILQKQLLYW